MLSKPPDWQFSKKGILKELAMDGEGSIQSGIKRLQDAGYLKIERKRGTTGRLAKTVWTVYDSPQLENNTVASPQLDFPALENHAYTKELNNKRTSAALGLVAEEQPGDWYLDEETGEWRRR